VARPLDAKLVEELKRGGRASKNREANSLFLKKIKIVVKAHVFLP
jgi:hypothetical protein